jgi:hypothetical protein
VNFVVVTHYSTKNMLILACRAMIEVPDTICRTSGKASDEGVGG